MADLIQQVTDEFRQRFQQDPVIVVAPGRICLIGEHVDYNDGYVLPASINKHLVFAVAPNGSDQCTVFASDISEDATFSLSNLSPGQGWVNYLMGVVEGFRQRQIPVGGVNCVFGGNLPRGAGMASSAALCCGFAVALNHIFQGKAKRRELARIGQFSEHHFAGVKCGLMDQYTCLFGEQDSALLLDCRAMTHQVIPFPGSHSVVLVDTKIRHTLATTAFNARRSACEEGVKALSKTNPEIASLRDVSRETLYDHIGELEKDVFTKCLFVVEEIERTRKAAAQLLAEDINAFGRLMFKSHEGLSTLYDVSCKELDFLVAQAAKNPEMVIGSRMMGAGFGGCTINLVEHSQAENFKELIAREYFSSFSITPEFYTVSISQGIYLITP